MADVYITKLKRSGRMVSYDVRPVEDVPLDVNTITFQINPAYTLGNGSLDGMVGSSPADPTFYAHVPSMRVQYGSMFPASYFRLKEAYALKDAIARQDMARASFTTSSPRTSTSKAADWPDRDQRRECRAERRRWHRRGRAGEEPATAEEPAGRSGQAAGGDRQEAHDP